VMKRGALNDQGEPWCEEPYLTYEQAVEQCDELNRNAAAPEAVETPIDVAAAAAQAAPAAPAPTTVRTLAANPTRRAKLRADDRLQELIAARRAELPDAFMAAPAFTFNEGNATSGMAGDWRWHMAGRMLARAFHGLKWHVDLWFDGAVATGYGDTVRAAYAAGFREVRLAKVDKGELLHKIKRQGQMLTEVIGYWIETASAADVDLTALRAQRRRALLTARERGKMEHILIRDMAAMDKHNQRLKTALVEKITAHWDDENILRYLAVVWPLLTPERQNYLAPRVINEIVCGQMNSAWITIVKKFMEVNQAQAEVQA
jgi:hypothetical protein